MLNVVRYHTGCLLACQRTILPRTSWVLLLRHKNIQQTTIYVHLLESHTASMVQRMAQLLTDMLKASRINAVSTAPVFRTSEGQPYRDISMAFGTAVRRAGSPDFTFHDLRHTFASRLVMGGVDLTTVKELMGHKHIAMALHYAHWAISGLRSAVLDRLAEKVSSIFTTGSRATARPSLQVIEK